MSKTYKQVIINSADDLPAFGGYYCVLRRGAKIPDVTYLSNTSINWSDFAWYLIEEEQPVKEELQAEKIAELLSRGVADKYKRILAIINEVTPSAIVQPKDELTLRDELIKWLEDYAIKSYQVTLLEDAAEVVDHILGAAIVQDEPVKERLTDEMIEEEFPEISNPRSNPFTEALNNAAKFRKEGAKFARDFYENKPVKG